uniref:DNA primase n=1 Tax=Macrostomum lignano TaxID=282301 RepID=A0A1I8G2K0_9PLAT
PLTMCAELLPEELATYYKRLYPTHLMVQWLSYRSPAYFANREFSMTLHDDIYLRFLSYNYESEFRGALLDRRPEKIDIGAVYSCRPRDRATVSGGAFQAKEKELVIDIDLTDYDGVRLCCSDARVCSKCWLFMRIAVQVWCFRAGFGCFRAGFDCFRAGFGCFRAGLSCFRARLSCFRARLSCFRARPGPGPALRLRVPPPAVGLLRPSRHSLLDLRPHTARQLSANARTAVIEYLSLVRRPGDKQPQQGQQQPPKCHPSVAAAADAIRRQFDDLVRQQDLFGTEDRTRALLAQLPEDLRSVADTAVASWLADPDAYPSLKRWKTISKFAVSRGRQDVEQQLLIQYAYPRLDVGVSTGVNHLLKAPFCVHPKTGRICVPFDPAAVDSFEPDSVPTLAQLLAELSSASAQQQQQKPHLMAYKSTSLKASIELFA